MINYDYAKLNGKIKEVCGTQSVFARKMGLSEHTMSKKLASKISWKQTEIERACNVLDIVRTDIPAYFFNMKVQY